MTPTRQALEALQTAHDALRRAEVPVGLSGAYSAALADVGAAQGAVKGLAEREGGSPDDARYQTVRAILSVPGKGQALDLRETLEAHYPLGTKRQRESLWRYASRGVDRMQTLNNYDSVYRTHVQAGVYR